VNGRQLFRTGAVILAAQAGVALIGILALRLYTDFVVPAVFGEINLILSALGLGLQLFVAGFTAALLRFYTEAESRGAGEEFTRDTMAWALRATAMLAGALLVVLIPLRMTGIVACSVLTLAAGVLWLFAMTVRNVLMSRIQAQRRQTLYANLQAVEALLLVGVTVAALHFAPSVESFLIGQTLALGLFLVIVLALEPAAGGALRRLSTASGASFGAKAWSYGAPFAPMSLLSWLANLGDRYTLAILLGAEAAGRYIAPFSIASRGMLLTNSALSDLFRPLLFDAENRGDTRAARAAFSRWLISSGAVSLVGVAIVYLAGSLIGRLLLAPEYRAGAAHIMIWISLGYTIAGLTQVVETRLLSLGYSARLLLPMILGATANIAFSVILIRGNGIIGAAQATCASFAVQNLATIGFLLYAFRHRKAGNAQEARVEPA
jgi:O-antigen/teichoic acid export membrane protein